MWMNVVFFLFCCDQTNYTTWIHSKLILKQKKEKDRKAVSGYDEFHFLSLFISQWTRILLSRSTAGTQSGSRNGLENRWMTSYHSLEMYVSIGWLFHGIERQGCQQVPHLRQQWGGWTIVQYTLKEWDESIFLWRLLWNQSRFGWYSRIHLLQ